jgi:hypothetical protein
MNAIDNRSSARTAGTFRVHLARTDRELQGVDALWRAVYGRERGWLSELTPGPLYRDEFHEHSSYIVAECNGQAIGTMRLVHDSPRGLPVDRFADLSAAKRDRNVVECQRLMVLPEYRKSRNRVEMPFGVYPALIRATVQYCLRKGVTHVFADLFTSTDTTPMQSLECLGFKRVGSEFVDYDLKEPSKSVALVLDVPDAVARARRSKRALLVYLLGCDEDVVIEPIRDDVQVKVKAA